VKLKKEYNDVKSRDQKVQQPGQQSVLSGSDWYVQQMHTKSVCNSLLISPLKVFSASLQSIEPSDWSLHSTQI
jgi:hypothetical protein